MAPGRGGGGGGDNGVGWSAEGSEGAAGVARFHLVYMADGGSMEGIRELLAGADPNFRDSDSRTAMHISACEEHAKVVELLLKRAAEAVGSGPD